MSTCRVVRKIRTLSDLLKEARGERSFREMERRTGISHVYLIQLENGIDPRSSKARQPSLDTLKTLSDKLHIDFATILASVGFPQMLEVESENKRLREALEFYADIKNHHVPWYNTPSAVGFDSGETARQALEGDTNA